jgi:hypothetical protein
MSIIDAIRLFLAAVAEWLRRQTAQDNQELGRLQEREANDKADDTLRDVIRRANADSVSDDEAFGPSGSGNNLPSTGTGRPANRPD